MATCSLEARIQACPIQPPTQPEYPGDKDLVKAREKINRFLEVDVRHFVDLTEFDEADQLQVSPAVLHSYGGRSQTRTDHLQQIQLCLGFRDATREDLRALADWLVARALEHDKSRLLFQLAYEHLRTEKAVRPGVKRIERLVMAVQEGGGAQAPPFPSPE